MPLSDDREWCDLGEERGQLTGERGDAAVGS